MGLGRGVQALWKRSGRSERKRRVFLDFLEHEESADLAHARQRDQHLAVKRVEILHVADPDLEKVVEVTRDEVAIQEFAHGRHRVLEVCEAFRCGAVENDADHDERLQTDGCWIDPRLNVRDVTFIEQALGAAVAGGGADIHFRSEFRIRETPVALELAKDIAVNPVETGNGRCFHR